MDVVRGEGGNQKRAALITDEGGHGKSLCGLVIERYRVFAVSAAQKDDCHKNVTCQSHNGGAGTYNSKSAIDL